MILGLSLATGAVAATSTVSSLAWFSMNRTVTATGMKVQAKSDKSVVIADYASTAGASTKTAVGTAVNVAFTSDATSLLPATHFYSGTTYPKSATASDTVTSSSSGLVYVTNGGDVDAATGYAQTGKTLYYDAATNDSTSEKYYYVDYKVCIASSGGEMQKQTLTAQITSPDATTVAAYTKPTLKAVSIDYYYSTNEEIGTYAGTLNVAGLDSTKADGTPLTSLDLFKGLTDGGTIPANKQTTSYLTVTMRVYVDGKLSNSGENGGHAFVNSDVVDTNELSLSVSFTAADKA